MELNQWPALIHLVVVFRWWVLVVEFKSVAGFGGGFFSVFARSIWWWRFGCGVESMAGFGGGFFSVFAGSIWWWVSVLARSV